MRRSGEPADESDRAGIAIANCTIGADCLNGAVGKGKVEVEGGKDGVLSIEFEGLEEPLTAIELGLANLGRFAEEIS
jgi:hypothetical protein